MTDYQVFKTLCIIYIWFKFVELQGRLSDYNLLVDKMNTGTDRGEVLSESRELAAMNEAEAGILETIFTERTRRQGQASQLEGEIKQVSEN